MDFYKKDNVVPGASRFFSLSLAPSNWAASCGKDKFYLWLREELGDR